MSSKKQKYDESYIKFGFTFATDRDGTQKPQCFLCGKVLSNQSMKPTKLREHLEKIHPENVGDGLDIFKQKKIRFDLSGTLPKLGFSTTQKPVLEASYKVAYLIVKNKKELQVSPHPFSLQLDETTDVAQCSQLLVFVRYVSSGSIKEEFLFCKPLVATTKAADVFNLVNEFFANHDIADWSKKLGTICTDGAPSMLGNKSGFAGLVKAEAPHVAVTHCILHRHALASKTLPQNLKDVMSTVVQVVNFIRARATNHRLFKILCQEVGSVHDVLLYHTEVRWLSRGQVFTRLMELRAEVAMFLREKESNLCEKFEDPDFVLNLAYLADIFAHLNDLNRSIQGPDVTIMDAGGHFC